MDLIAKYQGYTFRRAGRVGPLGAGRVASCARVELNQFVFIVSDESLMLECIIVNNS